MLFLFSIQCKEFWNDITNYNVEEINFTMSEKRIVLELQIKSIDGAAISIKAPEKRSRKLYNFGFQRIQIMMNIVHNCFHLTYRSRCYYVWKQNGSKSGKSIQLLSKQGCWITQNVASVSTFFVFDYRLNFCLVANIARVYHYIYLPWAYTGLHVLTFVQVCTESIFFLDYFFYNLSSNNQNMDTFLYY